ncbi:hypothetical protein OLX02_03245 [Novosphingobium sp. KCTC 2891]|uniref:tetratricopeptide repeat protein n=1 Tax=Novosphingobium sp. KCTC 2891 TaxID=2989730 RepID=UPI0022237D1B|nr:tetratricopeptide repeat protein [Novosphingobium sp. KCTC 2891]MCW1381831.1 hypothetical protein [Novosphingobium sp. KCTC 2891]
MKTAGVLVPLAFAVMLAGCGEDPAKRFARAQQEFAGHEYVAAQADLAAVLAAKPDDPAVLELHARNALAMGDGVAAGASLDKLPQPRRPRDYALLTAEAALLRGNAKQARALLGTDASPQGQRLRALALVGTGDKAGAGRAFDAALAAHPADARLLAAAARFRLAEGDTAAARALVDRALKADGSQLDAMLADAKVSTAEGDLARALSSYDKAAKAYPGNLPALVGKAGVLGDLGRTDGLEQAIKDLKGIGSDAEITYLSARLAATKGQWQKVRDLLQADEAKLADRDDAGVLYAQALTALGQPEQARARLGPLLLRHPENLLVRRELAKAQLAGHDAAGAVATLRPFATSKTASAEDLRLLARAAKEAGDVDLASFDARARYPSPRAMGALLANADQAMQKGNWGNAVAAYDQIMAVTDGRNPLVLNNLAWAHSQLGNSDKALEYARRAWREAPTDPSVMDTLGWLLVSTGKDRAKGTALLRDAAAKAPQNPTIQKHLAEANKG